MNKVMLVGRIVRDPVTELTPSNIKWSRFTIAINRPYGSEQSDYVPIVAWRSQAEFVENYMEKGSLVSIEGRFTSSTYINNNNQQVTRYEITADRVEALESRAVVEARKNNAKNTTFSANPSATATQVMQFAEENKPAEDEESLEDAPWDLDL